MTKRGLFTARLVSAVMAGGEEGEGATAQMYTLFQMPELNVKELPNTVSLRDS